MENRVNTIEKNFELKPICRRVHHRVEISLPIRIEIRTGFLNLPLNLTGHITDISEGGVKITLKEKLMVHSNLKLSMDSTAYYPRFQTEAVPLWRDSDILAKNGLIRYDCVFQARGRDRGGGTSSKVPPLASAAL